MKTITLAFVGLLLVCLTGAYSYGSDYGTRAYYSVVFDDRGLASAVLRLDYTNNGNSATDTIDLNIPGTSVKLVGAYMEKECLYNGSGYYDSCYYNPEFEPVQYEKIGADTYRLELSKPLEKGHSTSVLVLYRAFGYTQDGILGTSFNYETPKYGFDVDQTTVSIGVDQDLYLKEGGSNGNYGNPMSDFNAVSSGSGNVQAAMSSMYSYNYYSYGYTTSKSTLLAGESVTVSGSYGKNKFLLYLPESFAVLALLGVAGYIVKRKSEAWQKKKQDPMKQASVGDAALFSFMCAVGFSMVVSITVLLGETVGVLPAESSQVVVLLTAVAWLASAGLVYIHEAARGRALESSLMFVGFSVVVLPFMLLIVWLIYSTMITRPYPYAL